MLTILSVTETVTATYRLGLIDRLPSLEVHFNKFHLFNAGHIPEFQINHCINSTLNDIHKREQEECNDHGHFDGTRGSWSFYNSTIPHKWGGYNMGCSEYVQLHYCDSVLSSLSCRGSHAPVTRGDGRREHYGLQI